MNGLKRANRSPQREGRQDPPTRTVPSRHLDRQWSQCSLCSVDSNEMDEQLPIPGRESHTSDVGSFLSYIQRMNTIKRFEGDPPFSLKFWRFVKEVLETAIPLGYTELQDTEAVEPKSADDNTAFLKKISNTGIINPIDPGLIAEKIDLSLDEVLTELLYATQVDMLRMRWFPDCELLSGTDTCASKRPRKKKSSFCSGCKYRNAIAVMKKIKVVFCFNPDVFFALVENVPGTKLTTENTELLTVVPGTFTGSGYRYSVGCGEDRMIRPALNPGRYTIQCPIAMASTFLEVESAVSEGDEPHVLRIHVSDILHRYGRRRKTLKVPHGKMHLDIFTDTQPFFICKIQRVGDEEQEDTLASPVRHNATAPFTCAQQVMDHPTYLHLFENTEVETFHFHSAVKKMSLEMASEKPSEVIGPMKALCLSDENSSLAEDGSVF